MNLQAADGMRRAYAVETVWVTGSFSGTFMNFGPVDLLSGEHNEMVAALFPPMGTGDFAGLDGKFALTIREASEGTFSGEWVLTLDPAGERA